MIDALNRELKLRVNVSEDAHFCGALGATSQSGQRFSGRSDMAGS